MSSIFTLTIFKNPAPGVKAYNGSRQVQAKDRKAAIKEAKKLGYKVPKEDDTFFPWTANTIPVIG